jgi:hypothetical protein
MASRYGARRTRQRTTKWCMKSRSLTIRPVDDLKQELQAACAETGRSRLERACSETLIAFAGHHSRQN